MSTDLPMATQEPDHPDARADLEGWAEYAKEKIDGRPVIVSVSGGKDSLAVGLLLKSAGIPFTCVHMDTGWESPITEKYVREYLPTVLGPIRILTSDVGGMEEWCRKKGILPTKIRRWCTEELKVKPFRGYLRTLDDEPVSVIGIRADESKARSEMTEWEYSKTFDCDVWRPLIRWTTKDVIDIHHEHGAKPNPLYIMGASRVGCWPCVYSRKAEVRAIADQDPDRIDRIERLEAEVSEIHRAKKEAKGEVRTDDGIPTWFRVNGAPTPIRKAVAWSRTERGGKQLGLFEPDYEREGCMRWGLCDTGGMEAGQ